MICVVTCLRIISVQKRLLCLTGNMSTKKISFVGDMFLAECLTTALQEKKRKREKKENGNKTGFS